MVYVVYLLVGAGKRWSNQNSPYAEIQERISTEAQTSLVKVLLVLTYYHPHVSGLTIYVKRGDDLARRGHEVTVLTSRSIRPSVRRRSSTACA